VNAGIYYRFFRRFGLTLGYQQITSELNPAGAEVQKQRITSNLRVSVVPLVNTVQSQKMVGLDYTITPNAWLSVNYGIINVENTYNLGSDVIVGGKINGKDTNLPDYIVVNGVGTQELKHEFSRNVLEATVNVEF